MKPRPLIYTSEPEALGGNGPFAAVIPFPAAAAAAPAEDAPATAAPAAESEAPGFLQSVLGAVQSKGKLVADCAAATLRADAAEAELQTLRSQLTALNSQLSTLQTERQQIEAAMLTAQAEKQDLDTAAASQVAALGFDAAALPAASTDTPVDTRASLAAQIEKETDPKKLWALTEKFEALAP